MRFRSIVGLLICLLAGMPTMHAFGAMAAVPATAPAPAHYRSPGCDNVALGPDDRLVAIQRDYLVWPGKHSTRYTFFADDRCRIGLFTFQLEGRSRTRGTASVPGAVAVDVHFDRVLLTVHAYEALPQVAACGSKRWQVGVQQDVTRTGCLFIKPRRSCGIDHDILAIDEERMVPGFRTADMCRPEGRPARLQTAPAIRMRHP